MSATYFITGGTGFIGKRLAERLVQSGAQVKCLTRATSRRDELRRLGVEFVDGDLNDVDALTRGADGADGVFHLAGLTRELRQGDFLAVNCGGSRNVAQACAKSNVGTLVVVSSLAGAGVAPRDVSGAGTPIAPYRLRVETDAPKPISPYGRSKHAAELALQELTDATPISVVRPPYVFGEGDLLSLELFKMAKTKGIMVLPGYIDRFYSFVYVDDLVDVLLAVAERGERLTKTSVTPTDPSAKTPQCSGVGVYFPTSPVPYRFSEFGTTIGRAFGRKRFMNVKIPPVGVIGAGVYGEIYKKLSGKYAAFDRNKATEALHGPWICSGEKVAAQLGLAFAPELDEKIERTARWYESQGLL